jgi:hypothetical protein
MKPLRKMTFTFKRKEVIRNGIIFASYEWLELIYSFNQSLRKELLKSHSVSTRLVNKNSPGPRKFLVQEKK